MSADPSDGAQTSSQGRRSRGSRSSSLVGGLLRRTKSTDLISEKRATARLQKKVESPREEALRQQKTASPTSPMLPGIPQQPQLQSFGGEAYVPRYSTSTVATDAPPVPPLPAGVTTPPVDPYARTESMTHRGRYSYAHSISSTLNSPRRVRRRKDPTPYNVLIVGGRNSGKTSFLNFLKQSLALPLKRQTSSRLPEPESPPPSARASPSFTHHYQEIELDGERIGLTLWDSQGLDKSVVDLQLREMSSFVESKFDDTFVEEMRVVRSPGLRDTHIHCVFLILDPQRLVENMKVAQQPPSNGTATAAAANARLQKTPRIVGALDEDFDVQVLKTLQGKTTVIPVISKADTVSTGQMAFLKKKVLESLQQAGLDPLEALNFETEDTDGDDDDYDDDSDVLAEVDGEDEEEIGVAKSPDLNQPSAPAGAGANNKRSVGHKRDTSTVSISATLMNSGQLPFSIINPDPYSLDGGEGPVGRRFPWGFADPYNIQHCDFVKLKEACFGEWRGDLRESSREVFYERWRTSRLNRNTANGLDEASRKTSGGVPAAISAKKR